MTARCPECGDDYAHIRSFREELGWEAQQDAGQAASSGYRGDGVRINFEGECGHTFAVVIQFHKGNTFVFFAEADAGSSSVGGVG